MLFGIEVYLIQIEMILGLASFGIYLAVSQYHYAKRYDDLVEEIEELKRKYE